MAQSNFTPSEILQKGKRGRKPDPHRLIFDKVGLRSSDLEYLAKWPGDNPTQQLQAVLDFVRLFAPEGEEIGKPRDARGRFVSNRLR